MPIVLTWTRADISKYINLKKERYRQAKGREGNTSFEHHKVVGTDRCVIVEQYSIITTDVDAVYTNTLDGTEFTVAGVAALSSLQWYILRPEKLYCSHRDDGPATIYFDKAGGISELYWRVNGVDITADVNDWLENKVDLPPFNEWEDNEKGLFKMTFGGVGYTP